MNKVTKQLSGRPVAESDVIEALNREVIPVVREIRTSVNEAFGPVAEVSDDATLNASSQYWLVDATAGDVTLTLPSVLGWSMALHIKKIDASTNSVFVVPDGTDTIELRSRLALDGQFAVVNLWAATRPDASTWYLMNSAGTSYGVYGTGFSEAFDI